MEEILQEVSERLKIMGSNADKPEIGQPCTGNEKVSEILTEISVSSYKI